MINKGTKYILNREFFRKHLLPAYDNIQGNLAHALGVSPGLLSRALCLQEDASHMKSVKGETVLGMVEHIKSDDILSALNFGDIKPDDLIKQRAEFDFLADIQKSKIVKIGVVSWEPFISYDINNTPPHPKGFHSFVWEDFANKHGIKTQYVHLKVSDVINHLEKRTGHIHFAFPIMSTKTRDANKIDVVAITHVAGVSIFMSSNMDIKCAEDLRKKPDLRIAVCKGGLSQDVCGMIPSYFENHDAF